MNINFKTHSSKQTKKIAGLLAQEILRKKIKTKSALVLGLSGNLGSGKTTFVQGFMFGAGIKKKITSPTFVLIKNYKLKTKNYKLIYHLDCYRLHKAKELLDLGLKKILANPKNIVLIEWPKKIKKHLPKNTIWIKFEYGKEENERRILLSTNNIETKNQIPKIKTTN